jgi:hypothetical protein
MKRETNREWHANNKMRRNLTLDERIEWHLEHAKHCGCRGIPEAILKEIKRRGQSSG